jgi:type IV fimbrial biogenesis protein FimT
MTIRRPQQGFTLIELLATVTVAGVLLGIAVPGLGELMTTNRIASQTNEFVSTLNLARSEAVKYSTQVVIRRESATAGTWEAGWDVFVDRDEDETFDDDGDATPCETSEDCRIQRRTDALPGGTTLRTGAADTYATYIAFDALGAATGSAAAGTQDFRLCRKDANTGKSRTLTLSTTGRLSLATGASACP